MECRDVRERLEACSTGELEAVEFEQVTRHLESCGDCRGAFNRHRSFAALLRGAALPPVPAGFAARVLAAASAPRTARNPFRWWGSVSLPMRAAAALVLAAGLLAGALMGWDAGSRGRDPSSPPAPLDSHYADFLSPAPESSMVQAYLALLGGPAGGRK